MRLDRFLAKRLQEGKRRVRELLSSGEVRVNGMVELEGGVPTHRFDHIEVAGKVVQDRKPRYILLNKPAGVVSATRDEEHPCLVDLIDEPWANELHLAGRLDRFTTGLVILTNDSVFSESLTQPGKRVGKRYLVETDGEVTPEMIAAFREGLWFAKEGVRTSPAQVVLLGKYACRLTIYEGKHHQVKRMFARFGVKVCGLHREAIGEYELGCLRPGEWEEFDGSFEFERKKAKKRRKE